MSIYGSYFGNSGLAYMKARYYDPSIGTFVSPDTIVPDAGNVFDWNRYMYVRGRVLGMNDPNGHAGACAMTGVPYVDVPCQIGDAIYTYGPAAVDLVSQWADKTVAMWNWMFSADQAENSAASNNASSGNSSTGDPNNLDPNKTSNTLQIALENAQKIGMKGVENTTDFTKIESQLSTKSNLLGIQVSGNMSSLSNPQVQKGLEVINKITSSPNRIWEGTWKNMQVYEYIDTAKGVGVILNRATGELVTILQRTDLTKLQSFVDNGTAQWLK